MRSALNGVPEQALVAPEGIVSAYINPEDGLLMNPNNKNGLWEYFSQETLPTTFSAPRSLATPDNETTDSEASLF